MNVRQRNSKTWTFSIWRVTEASYRALSLIIVIVIVLLLSGGG